MELHGTNKIGGSTIISRTNEFPARNALLVYIPVRNIWQHFNYGSMARIAVLFFITTRSTVTVISLQTSKSFHFPNFPDHISIPSAILPSFLPNKRSPIAILCKWRKLLMLTRGKARNSTIVRLVFCCSQVSEASQLLRRRYFPLLIGLSYQRTSIMLSPVGRGRQRKEN